jgi:Na+-driven multidrug efflux pump
MHSSFNNNTHIVVAYLFNSPISHFLCSRGNFLDLLKHLIRLFAIVLPLGIINRNLKFNIERVPN